ncbi:amino-acid N-acetyltransferase [Actinomyces sp. MRS3W]|uniref:amino-acid N-acetyltransferase n=1 Tax=Actinomyces sp. MRS3W TaxID=2800796 RepID=UPI0028FD2AD9|nr:amino-acid N-acetyltransferase [Actinomyces sp. MRS3W]MDU0349265.1 amino-acid N-acetyltransferase [Actinomyces sp. MRS3W]
MGTTAATANPSNTDERAQPPVIAPSALPAGGGSSGLPERFKDAAWRTVLRPARPADARAIAELVRPYAERRILIGKDLINYFEDIQEFTVAEGAGSLDGAPEAGLIGCGALHVMWDDIAEVRTLAVRRDRLHRGVGHAILNNLLDRARALGLRRVFCLTFEVDFFAAHGFREITGTPVGTDIFVEMLRSHDDGVAEFLDLARAKPNTLGNTRMLLDLST